MSLTKLCLKTKTARASFELDHDLCFCKHMDSISLPPFCAPEDDDLAWQITVTPKPDKAPVWNRYNNFDGKWLAFSLSFKSSSGKEKVPIQRLVGISQSVSEDVVTSLLEKHVLELTEDSFTSHSDIVFSNINASGTNIGSLYVCNKKDNKVTVHVQLSINDGTMSIENPPAQPPCQALKKSEENSLRALSSSLDGVLQSGLMSDVTLSVDGHELRAHRVILAARSDVFKAMFSTDCRESTSGTVKIEDIRLPVFKQFLQFIYKGSLSAPEKKTSAAVKRRSARADGANAGARNRQQAADEDDYLMELLVAADKYLVEDLKEVCQGRLLNRLSADVDGASVKTLCDVLRAGHHLASAPLRQVGIGYLRTHRAAVLATPEWKDFATTSRRVAADAMLDSMMPLPAVVSQK